MNSDCVNFHMLNKKLSLSVYDRIILSDVAHAIDPQDKSQ